MSAALAIRKRVFVEEQEIPDHLDSDGLDASAVHVLVLDGETPVATGRLVVEAPGVGVLARSAVVPGHRGFGLGQRVVQRLEALAREQGVAELSLHPHRYLERFYERLGYRTVAGTSVVGRHELITMEKSIGAADPKR